MRFLSIASQICGLQDIDEIIATTVQGLAKSLAYPRVFFASPAPGEWLIQEECCQAGAVQISKQAELKLPTISSILKTNGEEVKKSFIEDGYLYMKNLQKYRDPYFEAIELKSLLYLPIYINANFCGILGIHNSSDREAEELKALANILSNKLSASQSIKDLAASNQDLMAQDKAKSELISTVSHELRTPLSNVLGFSELLLQGKTDTLYLEEIHKAGKKLNYLIDNFLDMSRIEAEGKVKLIKEQNFETCDLDWLAEKAWTQISNIYRSHKIKWQIDKNLSQVFVDADAIERVFINLFSNAVKYSPNANSISCTISERADYLEACVEDQGIGIEDQYLEDVFEQFSRIERKETEEVNGTGLGLWICREIIEAHLGEIFCKSSLGEGTKFIVRLPINVGNPFDFQI